MSSKVAVVTGANKGIGFAIVRGLCKRFDGVVYLTSRNESRGLKAVETLQKEGLSPSYHQLDISDKKSIENFRDYIKDNHGNIDILINNAAILYDSDAPDPAGKHSEETISVNYFSVLQTCEILFPIIRNGGRVINISSSYGHLEMIPSLNLRNRFKDPKLTVSQLSAIMNEFVEAAKQGTHVAEWGKSSYAVSKVGLTALTFIQQRQVNYRDIKVNAVYPGYVITDMSSQKGDLTIDEGAVAPLFLALDADDSIRGRYMWWDKKIYSWEKDMPDY